jgi:hypothetical protein
MIAEFRVTFLNAGGQWHPVFASIPAMKITSPADWDAAHELLGWFHSGVTLSLVFVNDERLLSRPEVEIAGTALAVLFVGRGVLHLVARRVPEAERSSARNVRATAVFQILFGMGVGYAAFRVNPEPPCGQCGHGHWGGTRGIVFLGIWLAVLGGILAVNLRRNRK